MNKGGGLASMAKGMGGKISKLDGFLKDKTVAAGKKTGNKKPTYREMKMWWYKLE